MAKIDTPITIKIKIKPEISWRDALKLRLAGGKYMKEFWRIMIEQMKQGEK